MARGARAAGGRRRRPLFARSEPGGAGARAHAGGLRHPLVSTATTRHRPCTWSFCQQWWVDRLAQSRHRLAGWLHDRERELPAGARRRARGRPPADHPTGALAGRPYGRTARLEPALVAGRRVVTTSALVPARPAADRGCRPYDVTHRRGRHHRGDPGRRRGLQCPRTPPARWTRERGRPGGRAAPPRVAGAHRPGLPAADAGWDDGDARRRWCGADAARLPSSAAHPVSAPPRGAHIRPGRMAGTAQSRASGSNARGLTIAGADVIPRVTEYGRAAE